ncbi:hypothetical protein DUNSADRAFT_17198 [Dunaliella salina]|uniref:Encoded protein n=1 Tax=Dunaliella salina TaxID=3046 RepID=A0ABQ7G269_DUNSA|nr:hypothetical protein DUNSADRAFT_17198 [Dunaliella salina]|eukprot:KAF5828698.1 hypothetical protein DUNSADRAFT_17198 [Dunaliella salina]
MAFPSHWCRQFNRHPACCKHAPQERTCWCAQDQPSEPSPKDVESPSKEVHKPLLRPSELPLRQKSPAGQSDRGR